MSQPLIPRPGHSDPSPSPYDIPKMLWSKIETYFDKYDVDFRESKPQSAVTKPVIVWDIYSRVPGRPKSNAQTMGSTHSRYSNLLDNGHVQEEKIQVHTVTYRFKVYASSTEIANQLAWDLERLLPTAAGIVGRQESVAGLQLNFLRQTSQEEDRPTQLQDDLIVRNLLFIGQVPVYSYREHVQLQAVELKTHVGRVLTSTGRITRTDSDSKYYISVDSGQTAVGIFAVFKLSCATVTGDTHLKPSIDYLIKYDENRLLYIEWDDTYGNVPAVGQDFRVDYFVSATRTTYPDLSQPPSI